MRHHRLLLVVALAALGACDDPVRHPEPLALNDAGASCGCDQCDKVPPEPTPTPTPSPEPTPTPTPPTTDPTPPPTPTPTPDWLEKKGDCPGEYKVPKGCIALGGTSDWDMRWMECHRQQPSGVATSWDFTWTGCGISSSDRQKIVDDCKAMYTKYEDQLVCVGRGIKEKLMTDESYVCRHHAMCGYKLVGLLGYARDFKCGNNHCWTEAPSKDPDGTYIIDPYNSIYYWCPK